MSEKSKKIARDHVLADKDLVIDKNLIEKGKATRYTKGHELTQGKYISKQTRRNLEKK